MKDETIGYRLSVYQLRHTIKETNDYRIDMVFCSLDEKMYIKRTYHEDKKALFQALMDVRNSHIPTIHEVIYDGDTIVIEEYIQGEQLSSLIDQGNITRKQACVWAEQLFEALGSLHHGNIIHRDVKPDNIIVEKHGGVKLIDYGIARFMNSTRQKDTQQLGTIGYAPPEQFGFTQTDFRADLYSAGVTIEEMCQKAGCPSHWAIAQVAKKCRELDPKRRYASARIALRSIRYRQWLLRFTCAIMLLMMAAALVFTYIGIKQSTENGTATQSLEDEQEPYFALEERINELVSQIEQDERNASIDGVVLSNEPNAQPVSQLLVYEPATEDWPTYKYSMGSYIDNDGTRWYPIVKNSSLESVPYIPITADNVFYESSICLSDDGPEIALRCELRDGTLNISFDDHVMPVCSYSYTFDPVNRPDYPDGTTIEAEILLFDMSGDGQYEIIVSLSDRKRREGGGGVLWCDINWRALWCVGYSEDEGFWQANGMMATYANSGEIYLNFRSRRDLFDYDAVEYVCLVDRSFVWYDGW